MKPRVLILILFALIFILALTFMIIITTGSEGNLTVESAEFVDTTTGKQLALQLKNNTDHPYNNIRVMVGLTNEKDSILDRVSSQTEGLGPGQTITVYIPVSSDAVSNYKVISISTTEENIIEE